ncbi:hypothetical protein [Actinocrispum wychmicini]|uniref:Uncharacterized protein n=1 Tax=Actinocrispum wychmicini TaxID=1213861 RepID=A0A4R2IKY6_9PSEU|nr:hypothetical protein [Actinocrispum wychmicini]TCO45347.1 hypothetical protein EV192_121111 [Actinocrispum wychmicini]
MKPVAFLVFGQDWDSERFKQLVVSLGGVAEAHSWDAVLTRDDATVWITVTPPLEPGQQSRNVGAYEEVLGAAPRHKVSLQLSSRGDSEWLAAEIVMAAADVWKLVVEGFDGEVVTDDEFAKRVAKRKRDLFRSRQLRPG